MSNFWFVEVCLPRGHPMPTDPGPEAAPVAPLIGLAIPATNKRENFVTFRPCVNLEEAAEKVSKTYHSAKKNEQEGLFSKFKIPNTDGQNFVNQACKPLSAQVNGVGYVFDFSFQLDCWSAIDT